MMEEARKRSYSLSYFGYDATPYVILDTRLLRVLYHARDYSVMVILSKRLFRTLFRAQGYSVRYFGHDVTPCDISDRAVA